MRNKFEIVSADSDRLNEKRDCSIKAVSIVFQIPYEDAHARFKSHGRKTRQGTSTNISRNVVDELCEEFGLYREKSEPRQRWYNNSQQREIVSKYTPKSIHKGFPDGRQLVFVRGHMFALVLGKVYDWTEGRQHHIIKVWDIKSKED